MSQSDDSERPFTRVSALRTFMALTSGSSVGCLGPSAPVADLESFAISLGNDRERCALSRPRGNSDSGGFGPVRGLYFVAYILNVTRAKPLSFGRRRADVVRRTVCDEPELRQYEGTDSACDVPGPWLSGDFCMTLGDLLAVATCGSKQPRASGVPGGCARIHCDLRALRRGHGDHVRNRSPDASRDRSPLSR
jgi:hypothetical protein